MNTNAVENERTGLFIGRGGKVFYATATGVVFYTTLTKLADAYEEDDPYLIQPVGGVPIEVEPLSTAQDSPNSRVLLDWIDACDHYLGALAAELDEIRSERPTPDLVARRARLVAHAPLAVTPPRRRRRRRRRHAPAAAPPAAPAAAAATCV